MIRRLNPVNLRDVQANIAYMLPLDQFDLSARAKAHLRSLTYVAELAELSQEEFQRGKSATPAVIKEVHALMSALNVHFDTRFEFDPMSSFGKEHYKGNLQELIEVTRDFIDKIRDNKINALIKKAKTLVDKGNKALRIARRLSVTVTISISPENEEDRNRLKIIQKAFRTAQIDFSKTVISPLDRENLIRTLETAARIKPKPDPQGGPIG